MEAYADGDAIPWNDGQMRPVEGRPEDGLGSAHGHGLTATLHEPGICDSILVAFVELPHFVHGFHIEDFGITVRSPAYHQLVFWLTVHTQQSVVL